MRSLSLPRRRRHHPSHHATGLRPALRIIRWWSPSAWARSPSA